jgi:HSP20 family protein
MQELKQALEEVKALHEKVFGYPAPNLSCLPPPAFAPGANPISEALDGVRALKEAWQRVSEMPRIPSWTPPADCYAADGEFLVHVEIPGVSREDVKVLLIGAECVVRGERKPPHAGELRPVSIERPWGAFERRFLLPAGSRASEMKARISAGMLELRIPLERSGIEREQKIEVD